MSNLPLKLKKIAADPSLQPPKKWFQDTKKDILKANPSYSSEQADKTVGNIWYNELTDTKRSEIREREGKEYGPAKTSSRIRKVCEALDKLEEE